MKTAYALIALFAAAATMVMTPPAAEARTVCNGRNCVSSRPAPGYRTQPRMHAPHNPAYRHAPGKATVHIKRNPRCVYRNGTRVCR